MILNVWELKTYLSQDITIGVNDLNVEAIRPHIYKHLSPAGSLQIEVRDLNNRLIKASESLVITDISSASYFHGEVRFFINVDLKSSTSYRVALVSNGYTFSESAYVGWCNGFDLNKINAGYSPAIGRNAELLMDIFERKLEW